MIKLNLKKTLALVAGSLVIALVVSILPGGFLVNAERVSARKAKEVALDYINDDSAEIIELDREGLDNELPIYRVKVKTDTSEYIVEIDANTADIKLNSRKKLVDNTVVAVEDFGDFEEFKKHIVKDGYDDFGIDKPTAEAELNQVIKEGKKLAISDYKEAKDDLDKEDEDYKEVKTEAKEEFKDAKNALKEIKKDAQVEIKEDKKQNNGNKVKDDDDDDDDDEDDKDEKLVKNVKITEKQALLIALDKIGITVDSDDLEDLEDANKVSEYGKIFELKALEIEIDDDNPPAYEIEIKTKDYKYEIIIHATSGKVLDYEREAIEEVNDKKDIKDNDDEDDNKSNNGKNNNGKSNNGKGNK